MRSSRRGNLLLRNPLARGECAVRILFYLIGKVVLHESVKVFFLQDKKGMRTRMIGKAL